MYNTEMSDFEFDKHRLTDYVTMPNILKKCIMSTSKNWKILLRIRDS